MAEEVPSAHQPTIPRVAWQAQNPGQLAVPGLHALPGGQTTEGGAFLASGSKLSHRVGAMAEKVFFLKPVCRMSELCITLYVMSELCITICIYVYHYINIAVRSTHSSYFLLLALDCLNNSSFSIPVKEIFQFGDMSSSSSLYLFLRSEPYCLEHRFPSLLSKVFTVH